MVRMLLTSLLVLQHVSAWVSTNTPKTSFVPLERSIKKYYGRHCLFSALAEPNEDLDVQDAEPPSNASENAKMQQFWLDLRGTAIRPNEALAFLQEFVVDIENEDIEESGNFAPESATTFDVRNLVDRIILSEDVFAEMVESGKATGPLLYVTKDGVLAENSHASNQSLVKGKVLMARDGFIDPVAALDGSESGWLMIDQEQDEDEVKDMDVWTQQLEGLVQILSVSRIGSPLSLLELDAFEKQDDADEKSADSFGAIPDNAGGLAMLCRTLPMLLSIDQCLASQSLVSSGTTETESGILVSTSNEGSAIPRALILPFDLRLWRTAYELRQLNSDQCI